MAASRSVANGRLAELQRYSERIDEQLRNYVDNCNIIIRNVDGIKRALVEDLGDDASEISARFDKLIEQYRGVANIVTTKYSDLANNLANYVNTTRSNLQTAIDELDALDRTIDECIASFS